MNPRSLTTFSCLTEHRNTAQRAVTLPPRQFPIYPPDPEGVPEADLNRLPLDGKEFLVPNPPDPTRLQPLRKLLGFGHVALHVAGHLFPSPHGYDASPSVEMPLGDLPRNLVPGRGYKAA